MTRFRNSTILAGLPVCMAMGITTPALAQEVGLEDEAAVQLETVVITATGTAQTLPDAPATVFTYIPLAGLTLPIGWEIGYPTAGIDPNKAYVLDARIIDNNVLTYAATTPLPVLTQGAPAAARAFYDYIGTAAAQAVMARYGFVMPQE